MKVLIIGATGFIGFPAAQALVRAGHIVYGQTRSAAKVRQLAAEEIIPVVGEVDDLTPWLTPLIATLDVVIFSAGSANLEQSSTSTLTSLTAIARANRLPHAPKVTYIYTSGTWVHGDNRKDIVSDTSPLTSPNTLTAWRIAHEQAVIQNDVLNGIVIRPSALYGRSASLLAPLFKGASEGNVVWPGTPGGRLALIHCDDLADLYVLVAEKAPLIKSQIFDASNDASESVDDILQKVVEVSGAKGPYKYVVPKDTFEEALASSALIRPYLARALLGWRPRKASLFDHLELYYNAWKASEGI